MAPLPPYLVRIAASILTQALTRKVSCDLSSLLRPPHLTDFSDSLSTISKLASSPLFFRIVDRLIHEYDHIPHRVQGRQVPPYQPPLGMRENEWREYLPCLSLTQTLVV